MRKETQTRTMIVMLALMALVVVNTLLSATYRLYGPWTVWAIYGTAVLIFVVVLRFQRLSTLVVGGLLAVPFLLAVLASV